MKKILIVILALMLPLAWAWSAEEDVKLAAENSVKPAVDNEGVAISPVQEGNLLKSTNPSHELPIITTNLITQDFEETWDPGTPPTGWTIIDNGTEGQQTWYNQDWHKYYNSSWGDTVAQFYYSPAMESTYNEWLITPDVILPGGATACSLTFNTWYDDYGTTSNYDTAYVKISTDGGSSWTPVISWGGPDQGSGSTPAAIYQDLTSYAGQTIKIAFNLQTFRQNYLSAYRWQVDKVKVIADAATLLNEDFNNWGPWGDNPPSTWSILDNGIPYAAQGTWNNNDWLKYTSWSSGAARVYYTSSYYEWQDEWMISPTFAIGTGNACTLSVAEYYSHSTSTDSDHGYIKVSTDGGSTWPYTIADHNSTMGSSTTKNFYLYDLGTFAGESNLKVAFNFVNEPYGLTDEWRIDDVSIDEYVPPTEDIEVTSIDSPITLIYSGSSQTITATLTQLQADSTYIDSIGFTVENSTPSVVFSDVTYPAVYLHGFESQQFSASTPWNASPDDWYTVTVTMYASTDGNPLNDAAAKTVVVQTVLSYPFDEDFEGGLVTSIWDWVGFGTGFGYTTSNYHSPDTAMWFSYSGYPNERVAVSPPISVSGSSLPLFRFWEKSSSSVGPAGDETHTIGFVHGDWSLATLDTIFWEDSSSALINVYRETIVDAGTIEGDTVRIVLWYHNTTSAANNWYVDDIRLYNTPADDIQAVSMDNPSGMMYTSTNIVPKGTFYNKGTAAQTFDAIMTIEDTATVVSVVYADTVSVNLASGATQQVSFASWAVPAGDGETYTVTLTADNPGDEFIDDNTLTADINAHDHISSGGPDAGFYRWNDNFGTGPAFNWYDISGTGTPVVWDAYTTGDDRRTSSRPLGFSFYYYGNMHDSIFISENGFASFDTITGGEFSNYTIPSISGQDNLLAILWDDLKQGSGAAYYQTVDYDGDTDMEWILQFDDWAYLSSSVNSKIQMQMILDPTDYSIKFQYNSHGPQYSTSHSVGIEDDPGSVGLGIIYNGTPLGNTPIAGLCITFTYQPPSTDGELTSIDQPGVLVYNPTVVTPTVTVTNLSDDPKTIDVTFKIFDSGDIEVYNQTETTVSIPGGGGFVQHAFATTWNANTDGDYQALAYITLTGDTNPLNDSLTKSFAVATHQTDGGPDDYGYRWIDNQGGVILEDPPVFSYVDISATGDSLKQGDDVGGGPFGLGFSFNYYGTSYDSFYVSTNGLISFTAVYTTAGNDCPLPDPGTPNMPVICPFWDDLNVRSTDNAYVLGKYFDDVVDYYVIQWHNVTRYGQYGEPMDFEVIIYADGKILFQYLHVNDLLYGHGESATVGLEDDAIPSGITYQCDNSVNPGNLLVDSLAVKWYFMPNQHDIAAMQFNSPGPNGSVNVAVTPEVVFKNKGVNDETNVPLYLTIDPSGYADTQTVALFDSGTTIAQQFSDFTPTSSGIYTLTAICDLSGDEDPSTDTLQTTFTVFDEVYDFESGPGPLLASGGSTGNPPDFQGDWEWGVPYGGTYGPATANSPDNCWGMNLDGPETYPGYSDTLWSIIDFQLNVGTGNDAVFGYFEWYGLGTSYYDSAFVIVNDDTLRVFNGLNKNWHYISHDLSAYTGIVDVRFYEKKTLSGVNYDGWYFDDFTFTNCAFVSPNIGVTPLTIESTVDPGGADTAQVTISNTGEGTLYFNISSQQDPIIPSGMVDRGNQEPLGFRPAELKDVNPQADALYRQELIANGMKVDGSERFEVFEPYYPPVVDAVGGPDAYGHEWVDSDEPGGPAITWKDISAVGDTVVWVNSSTDDHYSASIPIGFSFNFYGTDFTAIFVSENGVLSFDSLTSGWSFNYSIPSTSGPENMISPWWDDLAQASGAALTYFDPTDSTFTISFIGFENYVNGGNLNFQAILHTNGRIDFNYGTMNPGTDDLLSATIGIENAAGDDGLLIDYNAPYMHNNLSILIYVPIPWLSISETSGSIDPAGPDFNFDVFMDGSLLDAGTYTGHVTITSNDPDEAVIAIPVSLTISPSGCDYIVGDVNGSNSYNGLDITYGVAFFKGGPDPMCPFGSCPIPPCDGFFYCGDVNGSCSYNGLDITYGVAYFKGGPGPIACPSCPPVGGPTTIGNQLTPSFVPANLEKSKSKTEQLNSTKKGNSLNK